MFKRLKTIYPRWKKLNQAKQLEKHIQRLIPLYRYDYTKPYRTMGIVIKDCASLEKGTVMVADANLKLVQLHPKAMQSDRRVALVMFLTHAACTAKSLKNIKGPYIVYESDLMYPDGPTRNEQWIDYIYAIEVLLPPEKYMELKRMGFERSSYMIQRITGVTPRIIEQCEKAYANDLPTLYSLKQHLKFSQGTTP